MEAATDEGFREDDHTPNNLTKIGESIATRRPNTDIAHEGELFEWPLWLSAWSAAANGDVIGLLRLVEEALVRSVPFGRIPSLEEELIKGGGGLRPQAGPERSRLPAQMLRQRLPPLLREDILLAR